MAEPHLKSQTHSDTPDFAALMRQAAETGRIGAHAVLRARGDDMGWARLDVSLGRRIAGWHRLATPDVRHAANAHVIGHTREALRQGTEGPARAQEYEVLLRALSREADTWNTLVAPQAVAGEVFAILVWYSAWYLLAAGAASGAVGEILGTPQAPAPRSTMPPPSPDGAAVPLRPNPTQPSAYKIDPTPVAGMIRPDTLTTALKTVLRGLGGMLMAVARWRDAMLEEMAAQRTEVARRRVEERLAREAAHAADAKRRAEERERTRDATGTVPALALNGPALHKSVFGTWLMLVVLSWVSLIWGALISAPVGVGIGIMLTAGAGVIVVPLWGTLFGFLGMGMARDSTLQQMGFKDLPEDDVLRGMAKQYCESLAIPVPRLGTIDAFNAFAMGIDRKDATVALGRPLIDTLTPDETLAVLGHELGHVVSGDMRRMMLMRTFQNATVWFAFAQGLKQFARWVICWAAELAILAFSRKREYWADAIGAALAGKEAMIGALEKIEQGPALTADEKTHARFMVRGKVFSTHPSTADRIKALEEETYLRRLPVQK
jgi:heat shock protein HtpX